MVARASEKGEIAPPSSHPVKAHVLVIVAPYYTDVAEELMAGAQAELAERGATFEIVSVEGALEIPQALGAAVDIGIVPRSATEGRFDGVIALGCVIRGETSHYDIVVGNANHWLMQTAIGNGIPVGNAILTVDTKEQAMKRASGGRKGKGGDAARACLGLIELRRSLGAVRS
jgi:6,7-dimethyl-8-ribityllumazine synthase